MNQTKKTPNRLLVFLVLVGLLIAGGLTYRYYRLNQISHLKKNVLPNVIKQALKGQPVAFTIGQIKESHGVYEFEITINQQKFVSYITKDGKLMFPNAFSADTDTSANKTDQKKTATCKEIKKQTNPTLTAFVVSDCPYGLQMQRVIKAAFNQLSNLSDYIVIRYIGEVNDGKITSMHGDKEAQENLKQICIREEQKTKYMSYLSCYMQEGNSDRCSEQVKIDQKQLESCIKDSNRGLKYAKVDFEIAKKNNITASPTLLVNNQQIVSEFDFGGRNPEALKQIICCSTSNQLSFCSKTLSKTDYAASFSLTDEASSQTDANSGCAPAPTGN